MIAYIMKTQNKTVVEAVNEIRPKWDACWPNNSFVDQLIAYEKELNIGARARIRLRRWLLVAHNLALQMVHFSSAGEET